MLDIAEHTESLVYIIDWLNSVCEESYWSLVRVCSIDQIVENMYTLLYDRCALCTQWSIVQSEFWSGYTNWKLQVPYPISCLYTTDMLYIQWFVYSHCWIGGGETLRLNTLIFISSSSCLRDSCFLHLRCSGCSVTWFDRSWQVFRKIRFRFTPKVITVASRR